MTPHSSEHDNERAKHHFLRLFARLGTSPSIDIADPALWDLNYEEAYPAVFALTPEGASQPLALVHRTGDFILAFRSLMPDPELPDNEYLRHLLVQVPTTMDLSSLDQISPYLKVLFEDMADGVMSEHGTIDDMTTLMSLCAQTLALSEPGHINLFSYWRARTARPENYSSPDDYPSTNIWTGRSELEALIRDEREDLRTGPLGAAVEALYHLYHPSGLTIIPASSKGVQRYPEITAPRWQIKFPEITSAHEAAAARRQLADRCAADPAIASAVAALL